MGTPAARASEGTCPVQAARAVTRVDGGNHIGISTVLQQPLVAVQMTTTRARNSRMRVKVARLASAAVHRATAAGRAGLVIGTTPPRIGGLVARAPPRGDEVQEVVLLTWLLLRGRRTVIRRSLPGARLRSSGASVSVCGGLAELHPTTAPAWSAGCHGHTSFWDGPRKRKIHWPPRSGSSS
jgi:hypothetical protein